MIITTKALVIKEYTVGESDKYITLFTKDMGKIQVGAPRAKKYDRGLASGTQLFVYGEFTISSTKNTYRLLNVEIIDMFHKIREDLMVLSCASYIAEFLSEVVEEQDHNEKLFILATRTFYVLSKGQMPQELIRRIFEFRAMALLGFMPELWNCTNCSVMLSEKKLVAYHFSPSEGGIICDKCLGGHTDIIYISYSTLYTLQYILVAPLEDLFKFRVDKMITKQIGLVCDRYIEFYIDKRFKTLEFIKTITES